MMPRETITEVIPFYLKCFKRKFQTVVDEKTGDTIFITMIRHDSKFVAITLKLICSSDSIEAVAYPVCPVENKGLTEAFMSTETFCKDVKLSYDENRENLVARKTTNIERGFPLTEDFLSSLMWSCVTAIDLIDREKISFKDIGESEKIIRDLFEVML